MNETPSHRIQRIERLLQRRLAELIRLELRDPRLGMVNISHVEVSKDLSIANIFITILSDDKKVQKEHITILNRAANHLRHAFAKESTWRTFPALRFRYDESFVKSQHMVDLLKKIAEKNQPSE